MLNAFVEVVNRLSKVDNYGKSIAYKKQQLISLEASVENATQLFQNARAEYMEVLLAQRDLMEARMALIETKQQQLSAIVNAYQALGGGAALYSPAEIGANCEPLSSDELLNGNSLPLLAPPAAPQTEQLPSPQETKSPTAEPATAPDSANHGASKTDAIRLLPPITPVAERDVLDSK